MARIDWEKTVIRKDCPINFEILKCEAGWAAGKCCINNIEFESYLSTIGLADMPTALLEAAYFFLDYDNEHEKFTIETEELDQPYIDENGDEWVDVPEKVHFIWDEEPSTYEWNISFDLKYFRKQDVMLHFIVKSSSNSENKTYKFDVLLSDLAYAVAKCFTECLKKYGINGYHFHTYDDDINLRHLLIVKAYALKLMSRDDFEYEFSFDDELKLLQLNM